MPRIRTGPKLRSRYCPYCGAKCEGARAARNHHKKYCKKKDGWKDPKKERVTGKEVVPVVPSEK